MNFLKNFNSRRNENMDASLQEVEARVQRAQNTSIPDSTFFKNKLHAHILKNRESKKHSMNPFMQFLKRFGFSFRRTGMAALALLLLVAMSAIYFSKSGGNALFISPVYAQDNFEVTATNGDAFAVESNTHFLITSKVPIDDVNILKSNLKLTPEVPFKIQKKSDYQFEVIPEKSLQERTVYNLKITYASVNENQLTVERNYSFAFQVKNQLKVMNTLPGKDMSSVPLNSGIEVTFSTENVSDFEKAFSIQPTVYGKFEKHNRTWVFVPVALAPGQLYTVTIAKTLKVDGAYPLSEDYVFRFETESTSVQDQNTWTIYDTSSFLEFGSQQTVVIPIWMQNENVGEEFLVRAFAFGSEKEFLSVVKEKDQVPTWAVSTRAKKLVPTQGMSKASEYKLMPQKYSYNQYLVLPNTLSSGYYVLEVEKDGKTTQLLLVVSNLNTFVEVTETQTLVWVNNLLTQKPEAGAIVQTGEGKILGTTNESGVAVFETNHVFSSSSGNNGVKTEYLYVKSNNQSMVVRTFNSGDYFQSRSTSVDAYWKYISLDRGVYKGTDTIQFWGMLKSRTDAIKNKDVQVALLAPAGWNWYSETQEDNYLQQTSVSLNNQGMFEGQMKIENITPGYYTVVFKKGDEVLENRYIEIRSYIKPAYTLSVTSNKKAVYANESVTFDTKAAFFEGTPVSQLDVSYTGTHTGSLKSNDRGLASVSLKRASIPCFLTGGCDRNNPLSFNIRSTQAEEGEIEAYHSVSVFDSHVNTFLDIEEIGSNLAQVSSTVYARDLSYLNNDNYDDDHLSTSEPAPGKKITGLIQEMSYIKVETGEYYDFLNKKTVKTYTYDRKEKEHMRFNGITDANGRYTFDFAFDPEKSYTVTILVDDGFGFQDYQTSYYYTRKGYESTENNYTWYSLRFPENKSWFSVGENVTLQAYQNENKLENPTGPVLYYTLKNGLRTFEVRQSGTYSHIFQGEDVPNFYVGAIYFDGKSYNSLTQDGLVNVMFKTEDKKLDVRVDSNKNEYKPGEQVTLSVSTKDTSGNPKSARVNISVIDEAYFAVGSSGANNPLFGLYASVQSGEKYSYKTHNYTRLDRFGGAEMGCFLPGTKITMADGTKKNIEDIKVGDEVLTFPDSLSSNMVKGKVTQVQNHLVSEYLVINDHLRVTPEHRMFINGQWNTAGNAEVGDILRDANNTAVVIDSIQKKYSIVQVYNFTVDNYHTYIADGIWVHNDKGGGAARVDFPDVALYQSVITDANGKATLSFKIPDSITSWRVASEAVSSDLYGGFHTKNIEVSLPFFVLTNFPHELLMGDAPLATARGFGKAVRAGDSVQGLMQAPFLSGGQAQLNGKVFDSVHINFPSLNVGMYSVTTTLSTNKLKDTLVQEVKVVPSRITRSVAVPVVNNAKVPGGKFGLTKFVIMDTGRGKYYPDVISLSCDCGERVDQKIGPGVTQKILHDVFGADEKEREDATDLTVFQNTDGGIKLFPYADADQELSAQVASVAGFQFDVNKLTQYFYGFLSDGKGSTREEVVIALYGLSSLGEPVLPSVRTLSQVPDLTPKEQMYIGLSFAELGDSESARKIYRELLNEFGENINAESIKVKMGSTPDQVVENSAWMAALGAFVNEAGAELLYNYALESERIDVSILIPQMVFLEHILQYLPESNGEVTANIAGKTQVILLEHGRSVELFSSPESVSSASFTNIKGPVQIMSVYETLLSETQPKVSKELSVERKYFVNGQEREVLHEGELVEVRIYPKIGAKALSGAYEIVDVLPSGLKNVSYPYTYAGVSECSTRSPSEVNGQIVKFLVSKGSRYTWCASVTYFSYYARVSSLGTFKTDSVLVQSLNNPDYLNYSGSGKTITIQQ